MPLNLSKEEVATLSQEQLEAHARIHLDSERTRRDLCDRAIGRHRSFWLPLCITVLLVGALFWFPSLFLNPLTLIGLIFALLFCFQWQTNRRLNALVRLLDIERIPEKHPPEPTMESKVP
jgi:Na+/H+ antiporter NhaD/arsenite permease-like protein